MKKVFTNPSVVPCDLLKGLLEASGIPAMIKNERGSASAGVGYPIPHSASAAFAWPEVWVPDDRLEEAAALVAAVNADAPAPGCAWICRQCGEEVDAELCVCWNCETPKPET
jgi:hypothetical protein